MRFFIYLFYLFISILSIYSCDKGTEIEVPGKEPDTTKQFLEILWHAPLDSSRELVTSEFIHSYKNYVITSGDVAEDGKFIIFDKESGVKLHTIHFEGEVTSDVNESILYENILIAYTSDGLVAFNLDNFQMIWEIDFVPLDWFYRHPINLNKKNLILNVRKGSSPNLDVDCLTLIVNPLNGEYNTLIETKSDFSYRPVHGLPLELHSSKLEKEILIYTVEKDDLKDPLEQNQDLLCIDAESGEVIWSDINMGKPASSRGVRTHYYNGTAVVSNDWSIYGYDVNTGEQKWRYQFEMYKPFASWGTTMHLARDNRLYVNSVGEGVGCIDMSTGRLLWFNEKAGANCAPKMLYVDDMLIYGSFGNGTVTVLDAMTGEMFFHKPLLSGQTFANCVTYNEEDDVFYTMSFQEVVAFKLNRNK